MSKQKIKYNYEKLADDSKKIVIRDSNSVMRFLSFLFLVICLVMLLGRANSAESASPSKTILAFYYAWYDPSSFGNGKTPYQPILPYYSADSATIERQVKTAKAAGIDGFVQSWYGPNSTQQTEPNFATLLQIAQRLNFTAAVDFETNSPFFNTGQDRIDALKTLIATHAQHPAYFRLDGKPVIFFWKNVSLSVATWQNIRQQVDPSHKTIWIAEGGSTEYLDVFDGLHLYNVAWSAEPEAVNARWARNTRNYGDGSRYWAGTAMPGFDNSLLQGEHTVRQRNNGDYLRRSFRGAAATNPDILLLTSFNEWAEGSAIEPSQSYGNQYLQTMGELSAEYKGIPYSSLPPIPAWSEQQQGNQQTSTSTPVPQWSKPTPAPQWSKPTPVPQWSKPTPAPQWSKPTPVPQWSKPKWPTKWPDPKWPTKWPTTTKWSVSKESDPQTPQPTPSPTVTYQQPSADTFYDQNGNLVYIVQKGDTLWGISIRFNKTVEELLVLNGLTENSILHIGQKLIIA